VPAARWRRRLRDLGPIGGSPGASYLLARGIPTEVATAARVGFAPSWERCTKLDDGTWERRADRRVVFPIRDADGQLVGLSARAIDPTFVGTKVQTVGKTKLGVFSTDGALDADPLVICEAPIDALGLAACGVPAVALNGTAWPDWLPRAAALRGVLVATDADERGEQAAASLAEALTLGSRCARLRPPIGKDWNDALVQVGRETLTEWLRRDHVGAPGRDPASTGSAVHGEPAVVRCLIRRCGHPTAPGDNWYCLTHRQRADSGELWGAEAPMGPGEFGSPESEQSEDDAVETPDVGPPLGGLLGVLRDLDVAMYVEDGQLRYDSSKLSPDDAIHTLIAAHRELLVEFFTFAPGGRCSFEGCYRLLAPGDPIACQDHRREPQEMPPATSAAAGRVGT
jgi:hypothetical protein